MLTGPNIGSWSNARQGDHQRDGAIGDQKPFGPYPLGPVNRMENPGKVLMVLFEVRTGIYLGENDIIRHEDIYAWS